MLTNAEKLAQVKSTWKIILGVAGALGGSASGCDASMGTPRP